MIYETHTYARNMVSFYARILAGPSSPLLTGSHQKDPQPEMNKDHYRVLLVLLCRSLLSVSPRTHNMKNTFDRDRRDIFGKA